MGSFDSGGELFCPVYFVGYLYWGDRAVDLEFPVTLDYCFGLIGGDVFCLGCVWFDVWGDRFVTGGAVVDVFADRLPNAINESFKKVKLTTSGGNG